MNNFVHLHVHTDYSILDGLAKIDGLVKETVRLGQPAVAITDHGSLGGAYQLWKSATAAGIKPIIGLEAYVAPHDRHTKEAVYWGSPDQRSDDVSGTGAYLHITLLSESAEGLANLFRLHATAYTDGFYRKPRIDLDCLASFSGGIIATTGCPGGAVSTRLRLQQPDKALRTAADLADIFPEKMYVEIMNHGTPLDKELTPQLINLAHHLNLPLVATNDSHYVSSDDASIHEALLCVQTKAKLSDEKRFKFEGSGFHLRSREEMEALNLPAEALDSTIEIFEQIGKYDSIFEKSQKMPRYSDDENFDLYQLATDGLAERKSDATEDDHRQLTYELDTIAAKGYPGYFLVLADIIREARKLGIRVGPGRGSAGGCLTAFALGITELDPTNNGLLFERFLNPERVSLPDIDVDFDDRRRPEVFKYAFEKYGNGFAAHVGQYGTVKSKAAIHDAARTLGHPRKLSNDLTYQLPPMKFGRAPDLDKHPYFSSTGHSQDVIEVMELAAGFEGIIRSQGAHPAAMVISAEPLKGKLPLWRQGGKGEYVTSFTGEELDELGYTKYDFLGLKTLGVIDDTLEMLSVLQGPGKELREDGEQTHGTMWNMPTDPRLCTDIRTFELLRSGDTIGVFQLDSPGMQQLLRSLQPDRFGDISAVLALYRPGPMGVKAHHSYAKRKLGRERISFPHDELEGPLGNILGETYGLVVYQEQVLQILKEVAGYSYASAALIFDAMRKKIREKMEAAYPEFSKRMEDRGYGVEATAALWDTLVPFADYSFNKSHSTAYGLISYWTAYLKAHHPVEFMAALLSNEDDPKEVIQYLDETARLGIDILPPDVNLSNAGWTPSEGGIRYGLSTIAGVGPKVQPLIVERRPYTSLDDFFIRSPSKVLNGSVLKALIQSGAMDQLSPCREGLHHTYETLAQRALETRKQKAQGQHGLVRESYVVPQLPFNSAQRRQWEKEVLGVEITIEPVELVATRWLEEEEMEWIKSTMAYYPGRQPVHLQLGISRIKIGAMSLTVGAKKAFTSFEGIEFK